MVDSELKKKPGQPSRIETVLEDMAKRIAQCRALRKSLIVVRTIGETGAEYSINCSAESAQLVKGIPMKSSPASSSAEMPVIELIGDARQIQGVLSGKKDARAHFLAGGFRVRGDLRYLSDLALELGILDEPL